MLHLNLPLIKKAYFSKFVVTLLSLFVLLFASVRVHTQPICGFDKIHQKRLAKDPVYAAAINATNQKIRQYIQAHPSPKTGGIIQQPLITNSGSYIIPVVVHVLHTGGAVGTIYNPSTAQIQGAIDYLNQVYAGTYPGLSGGVGNMGIQFALAQRDPDCLTTNGIDRVDASSIPNYTTKGINSSNTDGASETSVKSFAKWKQTDYYNIWLVNKIDGADGTSGQYTAGYATFPTGNSSPSATDGTVMLATQMKTGEKTLPHEIGHAFALFHPFQGSANSSICPVNNNCNTDGDLVCDTDPVRASIDASGVLNQTCRTGTNPCTGTPYTINTEYNFMSYTSCYTLFTAGQQARVQAALSLADRVGLTKSMASTPCPTSVSPTVAYSLRQLQSTYTGKAIRVRRSNDNAILDVGFVNGYLDTAALKTFVGGNSGSVVIWYDQSNHLNHAQNGTNSQQPTIVNAGVITRLNGRVSLYFGVSNLATEKYTLFESGTTMVGVAKGNSTTPSTFVSKTGTAAGANLNYPGPFDFTNTLYAFFTGNASTGVRKEAYLNTTSPRSDVSSSVAASVYSFTIPIATGANAYNYINGTLGGTISIAAYADNGNSLMIGNRNDFTGSGNFWTPEIVLYNSVLSDALRKSLEDEQKSYYINIPIITVQPSTSSPAAVCTGGTATALSVTATGSGTLSYQWYKNAANGITGGLPISGATSASYTPSTTSPGTYYYYVGVSSSVTNSTIFSGVSGAVTINPNQPTGTIGGTTTVCANATTTLTAPALPTGGTITTSGKYRIHTFTTSGSFITPIGFAGTVETLIVAGGGGGGGNGGGGGGAGGVMNNSYILSANSSYAVVVGAGGAGSGSGSVTGTSGGNSSFGGVGPYGGGGGASRDGGGAALTGGSGGGGGGVSSGNSSGVYGGATSVAGQGNDGAKGTVPDLGCDASGGGGGGATSAGTGASATVGGNGGDGIANAISGTPLFYAAGGGGGRTCTNATLGIGGSGVGGNGGGSATAATSGAANTGSGGGGGGQSGNNGNGGSGVVIIRYVDYSTGTWSSSNTAVATVDASGVVTGVSAGTATIYLQNSVCSGASSTTVTVLAAPTVSYTAQPSSAVCTSTDVTYTTQSGQSSYTWSIPGVLNTNYSITSGSTSSNTVTLKWLTAGSKSVSVNYSNANGCSAATATSSNPITVTATSTITLSSAVGTDVQIKNINTSINNITYNTVGATGATITGLPTGVSGSWASNVVTISGTPTVAGTYSYTITLIGGCGVTTATGSITVSIAVPAITYTTPQVFPLGIAIAPLTPTNTGGAVPATIYGQVTTLAGSGTQGAIDATGTAASFYIPNGIVTDAIGNVYVADQYNHKIRKITPLGVVTTFAGNGTASVVNANTALAASFYYPTGVAINAAGDVYVAEQYAHRIRKISAAGVVTTFAGSGVAGAVDATGTAASFSSPTNVALDAAGNVYVADFGNNKIRKITPAGVVTTLAGGSYGNTDANGTAASFSSPIGVTVDAAGNVYVADQYNHKIRKITPLGVVTTFAGSGTAGSADGTGSAASFSYPSGLTVDAAGNVYVADNSNNKIRKITAAGVVTTLAGGGYGNTDANGTAASFKIPNDVAVDNAGNLYVTDDGNHSVRKISIAGYTISPTLPTGLSFNSATGVISGTPTVATTATNYTIVAYNTGGSNSSTVSIATLPAIIAPSIAYTSPQTYPIGIAIAPLTPTNTGGAVPATIYGQVTTLAGSGTQGAVDATGTAASFYNPSSVATDAAGNIYVADLGNQKIRKITPVGVVTTFAGNGTAGIVNATTASAASFFYPQGVTVDATGNVYVAEPQVQTIRKITAAGVVTTFAGGISVTGVTDATGTAASFNSPFGLATDVAGNVYVADADNHKIRKITAAGVVTTLAGSGTSGAIDATGLAASFNNPYGVAVDATGNVYVADNGNNKIRKITPAGVVTTFAGSGTGGSSDGTGTSASFSYPIGVAVDAAGNVYVADNGSNKIRKITAAGVVTTLAGNGTYGSVDAIGTAASFKSPSGIVLDASGNAYIADVYSHKIRKINIFGYTISPALPTGLSLNSATGVISGTPTVATPATNYTIVAYNAGGSSSSTVNIATIISAITWTGSTSTAWATASNWNTNAVPTSTDNVVIANTTNQPIVSTSQAINNLTINSGASLTVNSTGILQVNGTGSNSGTLTVAPGGALKTSSAISNVTLQQNVIPQRGWRLFANPFATIQTLSSVASTNGININTTANATSGLTDVRTFSNSGWANNITGTIATNQPYALFLRGLASEVSGSSYSGGPTAFTYSVSGTLNTTNSITTTNTTDFVIVGNPYAAPVTTQALTNGGKPYYTYQIAVTGTPRVKAGSWVAAGSNSDATKTIPVLGVVAYKPSVATVYNILTSDINTSGTLQTGLFGVNDNKQLELLVEQNGDYQDKLFVRLDAKATERGTDNVDLEKFYNDNVNVYTKATDGKNLAIDARSAITAIPVGISALVGDYNFKVADNNLPEGSVVYLQDKLLNTQTELKTGTVYNFSITADSSSKGENRFMLNFAQKPALVDNSTGAFTVKVLGNITQNNTVTVQISGSATPITIKIIDISGKAIKTVNAVNGINIIELGNTAAGMKLLRISNGKEAITEKIVTTPTP